MKSEKKIKRMIREEIERESKRKFWERLQIFFGILLILNVILVPSILHFFEFEIDGNSYFLGALTTGLLLVLLLGSVAGGVRYEE